MPRTCRRCNWFLCGGEGNQELKLAGVGYFDIDIALPMARRARRKVELSPRSLRSLLKARAVDEYHVEHVKGSKPGLLVNVGRRRVLIDGAHRGTKRLRRGLSFPVWTLTAAETRELLRLSAEGARARRRRVKGSGEARP